jgi:hypothetical protein
VKDSHTKPPRRLAEHEDLGAEINRSVFYKLNSLWEPSLTNSNVSASGIR